MTIPIRYQSPTSDTPEGAIVQCSCCWRGITLSNAVTRECHALSIWTCIDCLDRMYPGHKAHVEAERIKLEALAKG